MNRTPRSVHARLCACVMALALLTIAAPEYWHSDDDVLCYPPLTVLQHEAHRVVKVDSTRAPLEHCAICHWLHSIWPLQRLPVLPHVPEQDAQFLSNLSLTNIACAYHATVPSRAPPI